MNVFGHERFVLPDGRIRRYKNQLMALPLSQTGAKAAVFTGVPPICTHGRDGTGLVLCQIGMTVIHVGFEQQGGKALDSNSL
ncbi:MAG: hypothetical protein CR984_07680 [Proteobacteria bacterium]|nr:MAG: hypothetical protein CR984_07680 [Pseudomonadota bacterium]